MTPESRDEVEESSGVNPRAVVHSLPIRATNTPASLRLKARRMPVLTPPGQPLYARASPIPAERGRAVSTKIVTTAAGLLALALAGAGHAQPPTAPPPRPVVGDPTIPNLVFHYSGPTAPSPVALPALSMTAKDGRVEVRWEKDGVRHIATARTAVVRNGSLELTGAEGELATLRYDTTTNTGRRITVHLADGRCVVDGSSGR
jgi:hypothetical protein